MKDTPIISFIVPVYNVELYLEECLKSLYSFVELKKEIVLVDDGSTDSSPQIMAKFAAQYPDITIVKRQQNSGQAEARNVGLKLASGQYISFVDSDDFIDIEGYTQLITANVGKNAEIIQGNGKAIWGDKWQNQRKLNELRSFDGSIDGISFLDSYLQDGNHISVCDKIYKRTFLIENDINFLSGILHEDVPFMFSSFLKAERVVSSDNCFYVYRQRDGSTMHTMDVKSAESRFVVVEHLLKVFSQVGVNNRTFFDYLVYQLWRSRSTTRLYNTKLAKQLMSKPISLKKRFQCIVLILRR